MTAIYTSGKTRMRLRGKGCWPAQEEGLGGASSQPREPAQLMSAPRV
jgi:hypothetical protein